MFDVLSLSKMYHFNQILSKIVHLSSKQIVNKYKNKNISTYRFLSKLKTNSDGQAWKCCWQFSKTFPRKINFTENIRRCQFSVLRVYRKASAIAGKNMRKSLPQTFLIFFFSFSADFIQIRSLVKRVFHFPSPLQPKKMHIFIIQLKFSRKFSCSRCKKTFQLFVIGGKLEKKASI